MGHSYTPIFRITPPAGNSYTVSLAAYQWMRIGQPGFETLHTLHELITRAMGRTPYGYRPRVHFEFDFPTPSSNETELATNLLTPAMDDTYLIELSMDGGTTYRTVLMEDYREGPMAEKNIGRTVSMDWVSAGTPLPNKPAIGSGSW